LQDFPKKIYYLEKAESQTFNKAAAALLFNDDSDVYYVLGFVNSKVATVLMRILNPTLNTNIKDVLSLPLANSKQEERANIESFVAKDIHVSKADWDSFETSWDFKKHTLV
jgi:hypothetical protein